MRIHRITDVSDPYYAVFEDIYRKSFPLHEQRSVSQQQCAFDSGSYRLEGYLHEDVLAAFIAYWHFECFIYVEHYAVNPAMRGASVGTMVLEGFVKGHCGTLIILEVDPLTDHLSRKRLEFYKRLGFVRNEFIHRHPPYDPSFPPHELLVLSFPRTITGEEYDLFSEKLSDTVMKF